MEVKKAKKAKKGYLIVYTNGYYDFMLKKPRKFSGEMVEFRLSISLAALTHKVMKSTCNANQCDTDHGYKN